MKKHIIFTVCLFFLTNSLAIHLSAQENWQCEMTIIIGEHTPDNFAYPIGEACYGVTDGIPLVWGGHASTTGNSFISGSISFLGHIENGQQFTGYVDLGRSVTLTVYIVQPSPTPSSTATPKPSETPKPTATPSPTPKPTPKATETPSPTLKPKSTATSSLTLKSNESVSPTPKTTEKSSDTNSSSSNTTNISSVSHSDQEEGVIDEQVIDSTDKISPDGLSEIEGEEKSEDVAQLESIKIDIEDSELMLIQVKR